LRSPLQAGLKTDEVVRGELAVFGTQLNHGVGPTARPRVVEPHPLHAAVAQGLRPALGHHLDGQAPLEEARLLERPRRDPVGGEQSLDEGPVARLVEGAVHVVVARPPCRSARRERRWSRRCCRRRRWARWRRRSTAALDRRTRRLDRRREGVRRERPRRHDDLDPRLRGEQLRHLTSRRGARSGARAAPA
jgi:hypothetical protein